jgi:hypothetical protein
MTNPPNKDLVLLTHAADAVLEACRAIAGHGEQVISLSFISGPQGPACLQGYSPEVVLRAADFLIRLGALRIVD